LLIVQLHLYNIYLRVKILIKLMLRQGLTGNVAEVTCTFEVSREKPSPIALRASRAATANPRQTFHRAVWLFTRIRFNRIRLIRRRVLEIPSRSWRSLPAMKAAVSPCRSARCRSLPNNEDWLVRANLAGTKFACCGLRSER